MAILCKAGLGNPKPLAVHASTAAVPASVKGGGQQQETAAIEEAGGWCRMVRQDNGAGGAKASRGAQAG
eukprot:1150762-Pelagomonas_calceolata.AAC.3